MLTVPSVLRAFFVFRLCQVEPDIPSTPSNFSQYCESHQHDRAWSPQVNALSLTEVSTRRGMHAPHLSQTMVAPKLKIKTNFAEPKDAPVENYGNVDQGPFREQLRLVR